MKKLTVFFSLIRPKQWTKNLIVFAGLVFSVNFLDFGMLLTTLQAFVVFCMTSGAVYIFNDIRDMESDRDHPVKKLRPLAAGLVSVTNAYIMLLILLISAVAWSLFLSPFFAAVVLIYFVLNLCYSLGLKHLVILDVFIITLGFVLRAISGAVVINVTFSPWLIIVTILLSLFLGFAKRRHEIVSMGDDAGNLRKVLDDYSPALLDQFLSVVASATIIAYSLYAFTSPTANNNSYFMLTVPLVIYGILRYLYLVYQKNLGGSPEMILLSDKPLIAAIMLWVATVGILLYMG